MTDAMSRVALYAAIGPELTHYEVDVAARHTDPARRCRVAGECAIRLAAWLGRCAPA